MFIENLIYSCRSVKHWPCFMSLVEHLVREVAIAEMALSLLETLLGCWTSNVKEESVLPCLQSQVRTIDYL